MTVHILQISLSIDRPKVLREIYYGWILTEKLERIWFHRVPLKNKIYHSLKILLYVFSSSWHSDPINWPLHVVPIVVVPSLKYSWPPRVVFCWRLTITHFWSRPRWQWWIGELSEKSISSFFSETKVFESR